MLGLANEIMNSVLGAAKVVGAALEHVFVVEGLATKNIHVETGAASTVVFHKVATDI